MEYKQLELDFEKPPTQVYKTSWLAFAFHTLLRKSLDSNASNVLYDAICVCPIEIHKEFTFALAKHGLDYEKIKEDFSYGDPHRNLILVGLKMLGPVEAQILRERLKDFEVKGNG